MKATDQLLTAVLILANKASRARTETIDETIQAFEDAGLVTHTYVPDEPWTPAHVTHHRPRQWWMVSAMSRDIRPGCPERGHYLGRLPGAPMRDRSWRRGGR